MIFRFLRHLWTSKRWNAFHSPYLFSLFQYACDEKVTFSLFKQIELYRNTFLSSAKQVTRTDKGAGSKRTTSNQLPLQKIARSSLSNPFQCRFMSRLVQYSRARTVVELGTSLGISTAYLAAGMSEGNVYSVEGDPILSNHAQQMLKELNLPHIHLINDTFENFITSLPDEISGIDILFIDGDHRKDRLLKYYNGLLPKLHAGSIVIVDDIHWSPDMEEGWKEISAQKEISQSVDCFYFGLLFFDQIFLAKEHHKVRLPLTSIFP